MRKAILSIFLFLSLYSFSQMPQKEIDSLINVLPQIKSDTHKVDVLNKIAWNISYNDFNAGIEYSYKAIELAKELNYLEGESRAYNTLGTIHADMGVYDEAIKSHQKVIDLHKNNTGKKSLASTYANIGIVYVNQSNYTFAKKYFQLSKHEFEEGKAYTQLFKVYLALSEISENLGHKDSSDFYMHKAIEAEKKVEEYNPYRKALLFMSIADHEIKAENYAEALENLGKSKQLLEKIDSKYDLGSLYNSYGNLYFNQKDFGNAIKYFKVVIDKYKDNNTLNQTAAVYRKLAKSYQELGQDKKAFDMQTNYIQLLDSSYKEKNRNQTLAMELSFKREKSQLELQTLKAKNLYQEAEITKQNTRNTALVTGLGLMFVLLFLIFRGYQNKKKNNQIITTQKAIVEEKNKEITDSINYAKRLQDAILPSQEVVEKTFPDSFIYYKPKDIVAGDFYWMQKIENSTLFAVADCTGHGVPGAMVSIVCSNALNQAVKEFNLKEPAAILNKTKELVENSFSETNITVNDGMDIALCAFDSELKTLQYAGANNPLWIVRSNSNAEKQLTEIKATKQPIGKYYDNKPFENHTIELEKNDIIFMSSDGYPDQFGGEKVKKFGYRQFRELLVSLKDKSMDEGKKVIEQTFISWRRDNEQIDDVCVVGIKI